MAGKAGWEGQEDVLSGCEIPGGCEQADRRVADALGPHCCWSCVGHGSSPLCCPGVRVSLWGPLASRDSTWASFGKPPTPPRSLWFGDGYQSQDPPTRTLQPPATVTGLGMGVGARSGQLEFSLPLAMVIGLGTGT